MTEIWKDISGYEWLYQISNMGRVKSLNKQIVAPSGGIIFYPERIMAQRKGSSGYFQVILRKDGTRKNVMIHRLVALAFVPGANENLVVNHKDENKENNSADNLEWVTQQDNVRYLNCLQRAVSHTNYAKRTAHTDYKAMAARRKRPVKQFDKHGNFIRLWPSAKDVENEVGIERGNITRCCQGYARSSHGFIWRYA